MDLTETRPGHLEVGKVNGPAVVVGWQVADLPTIWGRLDDREGRVGKARV